MEERERIYTAIDLANLWKSCREEFGNEARVDFQVLSEMIPAMRHPSRIQQKLVAYMVTNPDQRHHIFAQVLRSFGYQVRERFMRHEKGLLKPMRTDWDVGITIDAMDQIDNYDTFALVSGDGDFSMLLEFLKAKGKKTIVLAFKRSTSQLLYGSADELRVFDEGILFNRSTKA
jgi:uncharacterized LabA/DUF88 family protein